MAQPTAPLMDIPFAPDATRVCVQSVAMNAGLVTDGSVAVPCPADPVMAALPCLEIATLTSETEDPRLLTAGEVAQRWGVSTRTVQRLMRRGGLRCLRIGRQMRFRAEDVRAYERESRS